jgi:glyoxylase-like metal-dependent hydrolase (beta-lactamase superfamily II)
MSAGLQYQVHVSEPVPFSPPQRAANGDTRMFQPIASTLIFGDSGAVLVDPPMTTEQAARVADWVEASEKRLQHVYVTHGHGDHWFGASVLLERFPDANVLAAPGTIELMRYHASPEARATIWDKSFPGQIPDSPVIATSPPNGVFELEGDELCVVEVGHTDTDNTTVLHVPSIGLVVAGDVVYNGCHLYLAESGDDGLQQWTRALDKVDALQPDRVVASHKNPALDDDPAAIGETRRYLEDTDRLSAECHSALEFFDAMVELYPDRLNPSALWFWGALVLFPPSATWPPAV